MLESRVSKEQYLRMIRLKLSARSKTSKLLQSEAVFETSNG